MASQANTPLVKSCSLDEVVHALTHSEADSKSGGIPLHALKLGMLVSDDVQAALAARHLAYQVQPSRIYLSKTFHAFFEMDPFASVLVDSAGLVQHKTSRLPWPKKQASPEATVKPLLGDGVNTLLILATGPQAQIWTHPDVFKPLCEGLAQVLIVQNWDVPADSSLQAPPLQAGPQSLARATHAYRSKSPNALKALVFLSADAWLGRKPDVSEQLISWLEGQQTTAKRLKLNLDITRMTFTVADRLEQRQLNEAVSALQACSWTDLLGYMAYADLIASDQKELIQVARCLGKSNCTLL